MSWPPKKMRPASGASSPASWPISVLLPAPFGPMMACSSPAGTTSEMSSDATMPPKRLLKCSTRSRASVTTRTQKYAVDSAASEQHDEQEDRTHDDLPIFRHAREHLLQHQERHRADHRPEHGSHAAEHGHDDQITRARPVYHRGADEVGVVGKQCAGEPAHRAGDHEADELVSVGR